MFRRIVCTAVFVMFISAATAFGAISESTLYIGGPGTDSYVGRTASGEGFLSRGEVATATFGFVVDPTLTGATLTLTVTNTSPAVVAETDYLVTWVPTGGPGSFSTADAPVLTNIFFSMPDSVAGVTLESVNGQTPTDAHWKAFFGQDGTPGSGYGFLNNDFDVCVSGNPSNSSVTPVIASIYDPNIADEPGSPISGPVDFVFSLTFENGVTPAGLNANWFRDYSILGAPDYIAAAKFTDGAFTGRGTVTNVVPEPATIVMLLTSMSALGFARLRKRVG